MPTIRMDSGELINSVALLVIDAQDTFIDTLPEKDAFITRCAFAIDAAQTLGIKTLFTEQAPDKLGPTNASLLKRAANPKVFHKNCFSALNAPRIEEFLRDNEIYHLIACGLETPICVYQTGLQAVDEDIDVTFMADALGSRRVEDANLALQALRELGCQILPTETVFYSLIGDATHPRFRDFSLLVKAFSEPNFSISDYLKNTPVIGDTAKTKRSDQDRADSRRGRAPRKPRNRKKDSSTDSSPRPPKPKNVPIENKKPAPPSAENKSTRSTASTAQPKTQRKRAARKRPAKKSTKNSAGAKPVSGNEKPTRRSKE